MRIFFNIILLIVIAGVFTHCNTSKPKKSVEDLETAFNNESTASEKYAKFAQSANAEGFDTIAKLFEAASKSEKIHAFNHGKVLEEYARKIGNAEIGSLEVKTTVENLQAALIGETYELQTMYPGFIRDAEAEKAAEAAKSFTWALAAEKNHLSYYRMAVAAILNGNETGLPFAWYVCPVCGNTYNSNNIKPYCELCLTKQENFIGYTENSEGK
jgi:rubrerythrin